MSKLALFALLFALASSLSVRDILNHQINGLVSQSGLAKRQAQNQCTKVVCGTEGGTCLGEPDCGTCSYDTLICRFSTTNATALCACYLAGIQCFNSVGQQCGERANDLREQCLGDPSLGGACTCGSVSPILAQRTACPSPKTGCSNGKCVPRTIAGPCSGPQDDRCGDPNGIFLFGSINSQCSNETTPTFQCTKIILSAANDFCTTAADCADGMACTGGRCQGKPAGAVCTDSDSCQYELHCDPSVDNGPRTCVPRVPLGGNCTVYYCQNDLVCGDNGVCVARNTVANGGKCVIDSQCGEGAFCPASQTGDRVCTLPPARKLCSTNSECPNGDCSCDPSEGKKYCSYNINDCVAEYATADACIATNKCVGLPGPNSCAIKFCEEELRCLAACSVKDPNIRGLDPCYVGDLTCKMGAAGNLIVGWALATFLILAL